MAGVLIKHLDKTYPNGCRAVRDLDLEIADGEFLVLVGPSGCGKSTTLRMIAGLEQPTAGEVWIGDSRVNDVAPADRDVAMVFQNYALYPHMNVRENMAFGLKMRGTATAEIQKRVTEAAAILSIEPLLDRRPSELSGGERQRVALGRAIVREPKVFLFDEPLSNLDATLRTQMRFEIARLHERLKTTVVYVTHDQSEAMTLGNRIVLLDRGVVQQVGTPTTIYSRPANRFVASFIGSPAMNFLDGTMDGGVFKPSSTTTNGATILGVRPEDLLTDRNGDTLGDANVDAVERLGPETLIHVDLAGSQLIARLPADSTVKRGDRIPISVRPGAWHVFSATDGRRMN